MKYWIIGVILLGLLSPLSAEIYFKDTAPQQEVKTYTRNNVKSKSIITYNVFPNQLYFVYVASGEGTILNTTSPIKNIVVGAPELLQIAPQTITGQTFFTLRPAGKVTRYLKTTLQVICEDYNVIIEVTLTPYLSQANKIVNLQDGRKQENMIVYTQEKFLQLKDSYNHSMKQREAIMAHLLFNQAKQFPIYQTIDVKQSKLELKTISIVNQTYLFNVEFRGNDPVGLDRNNIFLYLTPYTNIVINEIKGDRHLIYPDEIILFTNEQGNQSATILFSVPSTIDTYFYADLFLSESLFFSYKVNLDLIASYESDLFNVETR